MSDINNGNAKGTQSDNLTETGKNPSQASSELKPMLVSYAPHVRGPATTQRIMIDVVIALVPAFIMAIVIFGPRAALLTVVCVLACVLFEGLYQKLMKKPITVADCSAVITGILLAFNLPVTLPLWQAIIGCFVAIILIKQLFGGLGRNFANPAIVARIALFIAFPITMTTWQMPETTPAWVLLTDTVASPTPLFYLTSRELSLAAMLDSLPPFRDMLIGVRGGTIGETSAVALLLGGVYLMIRRVIRWHIPLSFILTVAVLSLLSGGFSTDFMLMHILAGGLLLGAIFMATDYVTSPQTNKGRIIFGIGCGVLTVIIRMFGNYPEGVSFAILFMNIIVPFINKFSMTKPLGAVEKVGGKKE